MLLAAVFPRENRQARRAPIYNRPYNDPWRSRITFRMPSAEAAARTGVTQPNAQMTLRDLGIHLHTDNKTNGSTGIAKRTKSARAHSEELYVKRNAIYRKANQASGACWRAYCRKSFWAIRAAPTRTNIIHPRV